MHKTSLEQWYRQGVHLV